MFRSKAGEESGVQEGRALAAGANLSRPFGKRSSVVSVLMSLISDTGIIDSHEINLVFLGCGATRQLTARPRKRCLRLALLLGRRSPSSPLPQGAEPIYNPNRISQTSKSAAPQRYVHQRRILKIILGLPVVQITLNLLPKYELRRERMSRITRDEHERCYCNCFPMYHFFITF